MVNGRFLILKKHSQLEYLARRSPTYKNCGHHECSPYKERSPSYPSIVFPLWMNMGWEVDTSLLRVPWNGERGRQLLDNYHTLHSGRTWRALGHLVRSILLRHYVASSVLLQAIHRSGLTLIGHCLRIPLANITNIRVVQLLRVPAPDSRSRTHTNTDKV